jgi:drug/metabolite transporter (DMT)-like permease
MSAGREDHTRSAYAAWLAVCLLWGGTYLGIRIALETIPPALVGAIRYVVAGVLLVLILRARGERLPRSAHWAGFAIQGFLMIGLGNGGVIWAEQWVPSGLAAVMVAASPFWMTGVDAMLPGGERLSRRGLTGLLIGFAGILLLVWPDLTAPGEVGHRFAMGVGALQVACIGWALGSLYSRRLAREENAFGAAALQMIFGGLCMLAAATVRGEWADLTFTWRTGVAELYLAILGSLVGYTAYVYALKHLPVSTVSLYAYVNPVIAVVLGTLFVGEPFGIRVVVASVAVFVGVAVVRFRDRPGTGLNALRRRSAA